MFTVKGAMPHDKREAYIAAMRSLPAEDIVSGIKGNLEASIKDLASIDGEMDFCGMKSPNARKNCRRFYLASIREGVERIEALRLTFRMVRSVANPVPVEEIAA